MREREREPEQRRWLTAPSIGRATCGALGERAGHVDEHRGEHEECPIAVVGPHAALFRQTVKTETEERDGNGDGRRRRISEDSLTASSGLAEALAQRRLRRTLCRRSISRTVTPLGTFHTAAPYSVDSPPGRKLPPQPTAEPRNGPRRTCLSLGQVVTTARRKTLASPALFLVPELNPLRWYTAVIIRTPPVLLWYPRTRTSTPI